MPAKYHPRPPWNAQDRKLSKDALVLADYLGRSPTRTSEGIFTLALGYVEVDTPLDKAEIMVAFDELSRAKLYDFDVDSEVVLDRTALKTNPLRHPRDKDGERLTNDKTGDLKIDKRIPSAVRIFEAIPDSILKVEFVALADLHSPDLADAIREASTHSYPRTSGGPSKDHASNYAYPSTIEGPSKAHPRPIEGPSREESESRRGEESRGEVHQLEPRERQEAAMEAAVSLVHDELDGEEVKVKYGTGGDEW